MTTLDIKMELDKIRQLYKDDKSQVGFNMLLLGEEGTGKTYMLQTARKPILIDSFDPGGTKNLRSHITEGGIIADTRWEHEDQQRPIVWRDWEKEFTRRRTGNVFSQIGTYVIDSFSLQLIALRREMARRFSRPDGVLQMQDWQIIGNAIRDIYLTMFSLPCDVVVTGHLESTKDEVSGMLHNKIDAPPSLQSLLPKVFDEIYILLAKGTAKGIERKLLTMNEGKYKARTRIGADKFDTYENADIKRLLKKAGLPSEDLPY